MFFNLSLNATQRYKNIKKYFLKLCHAVTIGHKHLQFSYHLKKNNLKLYIYSLRTIDDILGKVYDLEQ